MTIQSLRLFPPMWIFFDTPKSNGGVSNLSVAYRWNDPWSCQTPLKNLLLFLRFDVIKKYIFLLNWELYNRVTTYFHLYKKKKKKTAKKLIKHLDLHYGSKDIGLWSYVQFIKENYIVLISSYSLSKWKIILNNILI